MIFFSQLKKFDWVMVGASCALTAFGLAAIFSSGLARHDFSNFVKQGIFFAIGLAAMVLVSFFDYRILRNNSYLILTLYFLSLALLAGTLFFGPRIGGSKRWYRIGFLSLDPIELAKIILIVLLAKYFSMRHAELYRLRHILISGLYVFFMAFLVFLRPNLGGAAMLTVVWLGVLLASGIKLKHFLVIALCFLAVAGLAWQFLLKDYQKGRIESFLFPQDVLGNAWSQTQTKIAIGSGGLLGTGIGNDSQVQYGFLPDPHTDFIFSAIGEEWGLAGVAALFAAYLLLVWRVVRTAVLSPSNFPRLFAVGFGVALMVQFCINVGMNLAVFPVVGLYLPFVSYGGSGLIANFVSLGILQSIRVRER